MSQTLEVVNTTSYKIKIKTISDETNTKSKQCKHYKFSLIDFFFFKPISDESDTRSCKLIEKKQNKKTSAMSQTLEVVH